MIELDSIPSKINYIGYHRKAPKRGKKKKKKLYLIQWKLILEKYFPHLQVFIITIENVDQSEIVFLLTIK